MTPPDSAPSAESLDARVRPSYYWRVAVVSVLTFGIGLPIMGFGYLRWARRFDAAGVHRRDGKCYAWSDLTEIRTERLRRAGGGPGPLLSVRLQFRSGSVMVYPFPLANAGDVLRYIRRLPGGECLVQFGYP